MPAQKTLRAKLFENPDILWLIRCIVILLGIAEDFLFFFLNFSIIAVELAASPFYAVFVLTFSDRLLPYLWAVRRWAAPVVPTDSEEVVVSSAEQ